MHALPVENQLFKKQKWPERGKVIKMQPLGAIWDL